MGVLGDAFDSTRFNSGTILVTAFNRNNKDLSLKFNNVSVTNTPYSSYSQAVNYTIDGTVTLNIDDDFWPEEAMK